MSFTAGLHRALQQRPDDVAVITDDGELSFRQLADRVARLAAGLRSRGVEPGDRVGILLPNVAAYLETVLALSWLGAVTSPIINRWSVPEMRYQAETSEMKLVVANDSLLEQALALREQVDSVSTVVALGAPASGRYVDFEALIAAHEPVPDVRMSPDALTLLLYTGGTTGNPKGVMLTSGQVLTSTLGVGMTSGAENLPERYLHLSPLFHLAGLGGMVSGVLQSSSHVFIGDFDAGRIVASIEKHGVTATTMVPTMIAMVLDAAERTGADMSSLHALRYGAAPMPLPLLQRIRTMLPDVALTQAYGMTELGPVATILRNDDHGDPEHPERMRSVGKAALHCELLIVDPRDEPVARGEVGEIVVRGANVMSGYWRDPEQTTHAVRDGWMHTGDAGYLDEHGYLFLVDRIKDMVVTGGENVYSVEVERVLAVHPAIAASAVIGVPDEKWGERVHAVLVLHPDASVKLDELRDFVSERIARYKAPRSMSIVDELPLSAVGKILKRELRAQYRNYNGKK